MPRSTLFYIEGCRELVDAEDVFCLGAVSSEPRSAEPASELVLEFGCMLELGQGCKVALQVDGEERRWIEDRNIVFFGVRVVGMKEVGFGKRRGTALPATAGVICVA